MSLTFFWNVIFRTLAEIKFWIISSIRTSESKTQVAIQAIQAERRIFLTGNPLQNSIHDLMALLDFICSGLKTPSNRWSELLKSHIQHGNIKSLQLVLRHVMLRRVKKFSLPDLPPITHHQVKCQLNIPSQAYYNHHFSKFLTNFDNPKTKGRIIKENNSSLSCRVCAVFVIIPFWPIQTWPSRRKEILIQIQSPKINSHPQTKTIIGLNTKFHMKSVVKAEKLCSSVRWSPLDHHWWLNITKQ